MGGEVLADDVVVEVIVSGEFIPGGLDDAQERGKGGLDYTLEVSKFATLDG